MPLYNYKCDDCKKTFKKLMHPDSLPLFYNNVLNCPDVACLGMGYKVEDTTYTIDCDPNGSGVFIEVAHFNDFGSDGGLSFIVSDDVSDDEDFEKWG